MKLYIICISKVYKNIKQTQKEGITNLFKNIIFDNTDRQHVVENVYTSSCRRACAVDVKSLQRACADGTAVVTQKKRKRVGAN